MPLEIINKSKTIEKFNTGFIITIKKDNWKSIGHFATPCNISYKGLILELHNDYLIQYQNQNEYIYEGQEFEELLPKLLEFGILLPKTNI